MSASRRNEPILSWQAGDTVSGFALVTRLERRQDRNGRDYLDLELADSSGSIVAKVWSDSPALNGDYGAHQFVAFKGTVKSYRDQLQLSVLECRQTREGDRAYGFDEAALIPSTSEDLEELWARLEAIYPQMIEAEPLRRLAIEVLDRHGEALKQHPAAKIIHHAYRGGLLEHVVSMAELALEVCNRYPELDRDLLLLGVLFHDLGKLREIGPMPANDYTREGRLVGHVVIGRDLLLAACEAIPDFPDQQRLHLEHLILSHQGQLEFGSPVRPMTAEAIALHFIDNLDSKLAQLRQAGAGGAGFHYLRGLGRYVYLGEEDEEEAEASADQESGEQDEEQPSLEL